MKKLLLTLVAASFFILSCAGPSPAQTGSQNAVGNGLFQTNPSLPTVTAGCQGAGVVQPPAATSTGNKGIFTGQTSAATTCTLTWGTAWAIAPTCEFFDAQARTTPAAYSTGAATTTTVVVSFASAANPVIGYFCW